MNSKRSIHEEGSYEGRNVLVLGLARSGCAAVRLLLDASARVTGADENDGLDLRADLEGAETRLGAFDDALLDGIDEVVVSPGIAADHAFVLAARAKGVPVVSELELGSRFARGRMVAVTGTNGKSTTVSMIGRILEACGTRAIVAGNVGVPFCSVARELDNDGIYVLEASSFQLETIADFHPVSAGILNLTPDHLDRYESVDDYFRAKERIIVNCGADDTFFYNARDERCAEIARRFNGHLAPFSSGPPLEYGVYVENDEIVRASADTREVLLRKGDLGVVGLHNVENALAAVAALSPLEIPASAIAEALAGFTGLPHRMEEVARIDRVTYYNDSKATNVEATVMSLKELGAKVVLIAGGYDKGGDFTKLLAVAGGIGAVVTIGKAAPLIEEAVGKSLSVTRAASMQEAVEKARELSRPGDLIVLSPACASFDMYRDFEHRGDDFRNCVKALEGVKK